jgi:hypothetical protein
MGFKPEFFVIAAGFVEFCLAFTLMAGRLSSRVAAGVLLAIMVLAMPLVGVVDAIGHLPLVIVLVLLAGTRNTISWMNGKERAGTRANLLVVFRASSLELTAYCVSVLGLTAAYYLIHELAYKGPGMTAWISNLARW